MVIHDISREIFTSPIYDGDPAPRFIWQNSIHMGSEYNLSVTAMSSHTGTHIDAPSHYIDGGSTIDECDLRKCYGPCTVVTIEGILTGEDMDKLLPHCRRRLLLHGGGNAEVSLSAARVMSEFGLQLIGIDSVSIAYDDESQVHRELLSNGIVILENIVLDNIRDGDYILSAFPLKLGGLEASPVRAVLMSKN